MTFALDDSTARPISVQLSTAIGLTVSQYKANRTAWNICSPLDLTKPVLPRCSFHSSRSCVEMVRCSYFLSHKPFRYIVTRRLFSWFLSSKFVLHSRFLFSSLFIRSTENGEWNFHIYLLIELIKIGFQDVVRVNGDTWMVLVLEFWFWATGYTNIFGDMYIISKIQT